MTNRKMGVFYVSDNAAEQEYFPDVLAEMRFVPIRVEFLVERMAFQYIGISDLFDEIWLGEVAPEYAIEIRNDDTGKIEVSATKLKK